jgi:cell cycle checkpoint protein
MQLQDDHQPRLSKNSIAHESSQASNEFQASSLNDWKPQWPSSEAVATDSPRPASKDMDDSEDLIEDDYDSYDELFTQHFTNDDLSLLDEAGATSIAKYTQSQQIKKPVSATKRFLLPSKSSPHPDSSALPKPNKEDLPWAQRYAPLDLEELAVHKRKVRDVEQWLDDALARRPCRVCQKYSLSIII